MSQSTLRIAMDNDLFVSRGHHFIPVGQRSYFNPTSVNREDNDA